ncbi:bifunctional 2',3'-cyclic-nucleotide 2'-phosphodiesterase/3'-nucleotidase [Rhodoferax saidenbachensis]|uniref:2',3'-cyclic-nucleotide 2'-phosphodiesterase/3'-nucleotidase n=1 Tax=Rhodoferax saidenbachensis TaxID=1484693 RepID=A0ABU1ZRE3_9BURK|nr:bifunctional 2',3'-cyclic-nucleotide 2'-phosphodiesterase/3'-nucleotidase [Rhodoferax saidenbachensis]MDR7308113.1 2',3'-cyclic-nucleotide 2'-phosphodiesterase/3'-nucleotidase [Rhodoferax saidenbachensis]
MTFPSSLRLASALLLAALGTAANAEQLKLRILETTDVHINLLSYDYYQDKPTDQYGLARAISLIKAARSETPNSLLFDNGDLLQGNPLGDVVARVAPLQPGQTHPAYKVMNPLGYDAANLGNHEFNYGLDFLRRSIAGAAFPYVNANVLLADGKQDSATPTHAFTPYVLLDRRFKDASGKEQKLRVGVIGFVPPQIMQWDKANLDGKVVTRDMVDMAQRYVPEMRAKGAQLVIAIPHSGFEKGEIGSFAENAVSRLAEVPGVDAILFGHAHAEFPGKAFADYPKVDIARGTINGVPAVMPGRWGDHLGVIDLTLDNSSGSWKVVGSQAAIRPIFDRAAKQSLATEDPMVMQLIGAEHQRTLDYVRNKVALSSAPIYSYFAQVADDPSIQIVSNAQIAYVKRAMQGTDYEKYPVLSAAAPFKAGGRQGWNYYTDIPAGPLAIKHMADLYIYPNTLKAMLITGAEVREWLEMSAGQFLRIDPKGPARQPLINDAFPSYNFDVIDGVQYEIDVSQSARYDAKGQLANPDAHRIRKLLFEGKPIVDTARFVVATNNYRAFGGGNFPGLKADKVVLDAPDENRQALVEYLRMSDKLAADHTVNPTADGNWRIARIPGVHPTFLSGSAASRFLGQHSEIRLVQDNGDGSALYELVD